jgi:hypothetical protein
MGFEKHAGCPLLCELASDGQANNAASNDKYIHKNNAPDEENKFGLKCILGEGSTLIEGGGIPPWGRGFLEGRVFQ